MCRKVRGGVWLVASLLGVGGCYVYPPVETVPTPGTDVRLDLDDRGRAGLGGLIGSSAASIEGVLQTNPDSAYQLRVTSVVYTNGQSNRWNGERLTVPTVFVVNARERKFSRSRTYLTAAGVVVGLGAFIASRGLLGSGSTDENGRGTGGGGNDH